MGSSGYCRQIALDIMFEGTLHQVMEEKSFTSTKCIESTADSGNLSAERDPSHSWFFWHISLSTSHTSQGSYF